MGTENVPDDVWLTPNEVAEIFRVDPKTIGRWADRGQLRYIRTPGGHRRFKESEIKALLKFKFEEN